MMALLLLGVQAVFVLCALALTLAVCALALQLFAAPRVRQRYQLPACARPSIAVLVPAHNEAACIGATLASIQAQLHGGDRLLVVADHCRDDTVLAAWLAGADVAVRNGNEESDMDCVLAFGVHQLAQAPPQVVIVVDAGCLLEANALDWLANTCAATRRPVQAACLMRARDGADPAQRVRQLAWTVHHWLRPLGWRRLGMGCQLAGSGIALPWPLAGPHSVADLKLGLDFALGGSAPLFCADAVVTGVLPENAAGRPALRARGEHSRFTLIAEYVPRLILRGVARRDPVLLALAVDLCVPPISMLLALAVAAGAAGALAWTSSGEAWPWAMVAPLVVLMAAALAAAWLKAGRAILPAHQLGHVVPYVLKKIAPSLRMLMRLRHIAPRRSE